MKKLCYILFSAIVFVSCKKANELDTPNNLTVEAVAKELGFTVKFPDQTTKRVLKKFKSVENWRAKIVTQREHAKEHKAHNPTQKAAQSANSTSTSGKAIKVLENGLEYNFTYGEDDEGYTLLDFLLMQGFDVPLCDMAGASSTCVSKLTSGQIDQGDQSFLSDCELQANWVLLCCAYPMGNITIKVNMEEEFYSPFGWGNNCSGDDDGESLEDMMEISGGGYELSSQTNFVNYFNPNYNNYDGNGAVILTDLRGITKNWVVTESITGQWRIKSKEAFLEESSPGQNDWFIKEWNHQDVDLVNNNFRLDITFRENLNIYGLISLSRKRVTFGVVGGQAKLKSRKLNSNGQPVLFGSYSNFNSQTYNFIYDVIN